MKHFLLSLFFIFTASLAASEPFDKALEFNHRPPTEIETVDFFGWGGFYKDHNRLPRGLEVPKEFVRVPKVTKTTCGKRCSFECVEKDLCIVREVIVKNRIQMPLLYNAIIYPERAYNTAFCITLAVRKVCRALRDNGFSKPALCAPRDQFFRMVNKRFESKPKLKIADLDGIATSVINQYLPKD